MKKNVLFVPNVADCIVLPTVPPDTGQAWPPDTMVPRETARAQVLPCSSPHTDLAGNGAAQWPEPAASKSSDQTASAPLLSQGHLYSPQTPPRKNIDLIINLYILLVCFCKGYEINSYFLKTLG